MGFPFQKILAGFFQIFSAGILEKSGFPARRKNQGGYMAQKIIVGYLFRQTKAGISRGYFKA